MALEAVVFSQGHLLGSSMKDPHGIPAGGASAWNFSFNGGAGTGGGNGRGSKAAAPAAEGGDGGRTLLHGNPDASCTSMPPEAPGKEETPPPPATAAGGRRKRRRAKVFKNQEEVENQRMTHIAVERNRRKQMNEYLAVLRSLMPASYVQRGDQASIIGGAINFVKELEQLVQSLEARSRIEQRMDSNSAAPFAGFFTFPQYSTSAAASSHATNSSSNTAVVAGGEAEEGGRPAPALADIEVTMVETHANLKVLSRRQPKQLLKMVLGLQSLRFTILHLNVTTVAEMAFCSFSLKVEEDCQLTSVGDIATAVHQLIGTIQGEAECDSCTI